MSASPPLAPAFPTLEGPETKFADESALIARLVAGAGIDPATRAAMSDRAAALVTRIRREKKPTLMERFLAEYGLSSREGVALMCLAEAMLRVPDRHTLDALIRDKIVPAEWGGHLGQASSSLINASTWALMLTGKVLDDDHPGMAGMLRGMVRRLGEPVIRTAVSRVMKEMGRQFVLGETIDTALRNARANEARGYTYSYDMLGEAAMTAADARRYAADYEHAIRAIGRAAVQGSVTANPGISIKLSALHPRYEVAQRPRVLAELVPVVAHLARLSREMGIGIQVDAEEQARLSLSLEVIDAAMADPALRGWDGFGVVVQAYGKRAGAVIDILYDMAGRHDQRINLRLVKGAYWDSEMKLAQVEGMPGFPLFTSKVATDVSYICLAQKLFGMGDRIYPQFAGHNAHTVSAILELAAGRPFELQRLHGMGERLHDIVLEETGGRCRIYAPVGPHRDLLAYLVRRLLENGANSSFVHQVVDESIPAETIARDPFADLATARPPAGLVAPADIFGPGRQASMGFDLTDARVLEAIGAARQVTPADVGPATVSPPHGPLRPVLNPADGTMVARVGEADAATVARALDDARCWDTAPAARAAVLRRAAQLYEEHYGSIFALLAREAGKTLGDAVGELREACDFLRYYAARGERSVRSPRGVVVAISPWNFPLAIFTGQIAAALMAGNAVLAKPAEQTPLIAAQVVALLHRAGVPPAALQLLPGEGETVGAALTADSRVKGVVFTGSTETARRIAASMADHLEPGTPLVAETGGLNAMVVDSTALPEQAVRDIVASAFRSAGQRCSALRCLYVQEDIAPQLIDMLKGAMDQLTVGDPWDLTTDVGPIIDSNARDEITAYVEANAHRILHRLSVPPTGSFVAPVLLSVSGIGEIEREVFGPVLHVATFAAERLEAVVAEVNATGYGLTFGLHSRIDAHVQKICDRVRAGNIYVNRNQIGAVVGSQPFGGEGLSGTGPKAGGPLYLPVFHASAPPPVAGAAWDGPADLALLGRRLREGPDTAPRVRPMPGPTGEDNRLTLSPRAPLVCLGPGTEAAAAQAAAVRALGGRAVEVDGDVPPETLAALDGISGALWWGDRSTARRHARALAARPGEIRRLVCAMPEAAHVTAERHLCIDTTAAGGNVALMAGGSVAPPVAAGV